MSLPTAGVFTTPVFPTKVILLSSYGHQQPTVDSTNNKWSPTPFSIWVPCHCSMVCGRGQSDWQHPPPPNCDGAFFPKIPASNFTTIMKLTANHSSVKLDPHLLTAHCMRSGALPSMALNDSRVIIIIPWTRLRIGDWFLHSTLPLTPIIRLGSASGVVGLRAIGSRGDVVPVPSCVLIRSLQYTISLLV